MAIPYSTDELARRLHNLIRLGTITQINHAMQRVRVQTGALETNWLKWHTARAGNSKVWDPPSPGEHVILFAPGGDLAGAVVLASLDSQQNPPPSISPDDVVRVMPDASRFAYDHAAGALSITGIKTLLVDAQDSITFRAGNHIRLDAPQTTSTGRHTVEGLLTYLAGMIGHSGAEHGTTITGDITHTQGNLSSNNVVLHLHVHTGVRAGGDSTGGPV